MSKITDFIDLDIPANDLAATLRVLKQFKDCESVEEWAFIPFVAWSKLEQLEEFLEHRVNGKPLESDTIAYMGATTNTN